jgi:cyclohexyl-isocyanide hydratase
MRSSTSDNRLLTGFVVFPGFTALDLIGPHEVIVRGNTECVLAAATLDAVLSKDGIRIVPDVTFDACPQLDVLVVPGGPGQEAAQTDSALLSFLTRQSAGARLTASVCTGALLLAGAGLLKGRRATTHWLAMEELARLGAIPCNERLVWDHPFVTAAGVSAGIDMALSLVAVLDGATAAQRIQLAIQYDPHPPFTSGSPDTAPQEVVQQLRSTSRFTKESA